MFDVWLAWRSVPTLAEGLVVTLWISAVAMVLASAFGLMLALGRLSERRLLRALSTAYVEFIRNTPLLNQLFLLFFGLPILGITIPAYGVAILGLAGLHAAYMAEVFRGGIEFVSSRQREAGLALGMTRGKVMRLIILPQAIPASLPPLVNQLILLIKDSSLLCTIGIAELTMRGRVLAEETAATYEAFLMLALMYLTVTGALSMVSRWLEPRLRPVT